MSTLLYIKISPRTGRSHSIAVADAFIDAYRTKNPDDTIQTIDLFKKDLPPFDLDAANAKYKILHGKDHDDRDKAIWRNIEAVIDEFKSADKYVIAVPMWNFSIPYRLKQYIDILVQPGYTFGFTEDGRYKGLVTGKPILAVYARGGEYTGERAAMDFQKSYLEAILGFIGFEQIESVIVEPTLAEGPDVCKEKQDAAVAKARELAANF